MALTNKNLIRFCQNMLGAPYWLNTTCVKATKNVYKVNSMRFPEEYGKRPLEYYEEIIKANEVVTDTIGLIKGFAWTNGGEDIIMRRGTECALVPYKIGDNNCPDKSVNGMFSWATTQKVQWGPIDTLPEIPGLIITANDKLAIYEGKGYIIEASRKKGQVVREKLNSFDWDFWYELPFLSYEEEVVVLSTEEKEAFVLQLNGLVIATSNALYREEANEDSKFLGVINKGTQLEAYNDSTSKWVHIKNGEKEGYSPSELFIYYPEKPTRASSEVPEGMDKNKQGVYKMLANASIRGAASPKGAPYEVLPKESEVNCTGGFTGNWLHVYVKRGKESYVGYIDQKYLKKVEEE